LTPESTERETGPAEKRRSAGWKERAKALLQELDALRLAAQHPRTPRRAKWLLVAIIAYAVSPIDLIPDFIPVVGHLDDLILLPLGILVVLSWIPRDVLEECRESVRAKAGARATT
jgi:uncharacterized membrane protein YkvA (DUF1232 family)